MDESTVKVQTDGRGRILEMELDHLPHISQWRLDFDADAGYLEKQLMRGRLSFPVHVQVEGKGLGPGAVVLIDTTPGAGTVDLTREQSDGAHARRLLAAAATLNETCARAYEAGLRVEVSVEEIGKVTRDDGVPVVRVLASRPVPGS